MRVDVARRFAVSLHEGYDYIVAIDNSPEYWPGLIRVVPSSRWSAPGDHAMLTMRFLGRPVELAMELTRIEPYCLVEYTSIQRGLPVAHHERHFTDDHGALKYRIVIGLAPRAGARGLFDRLLVAPAARRAAEETMENLQRRFGDSV